jgi:pyruvate carboxylase
VSDAHEDGTRTVFFELNGQPRSVKVPDRSQPALKPPRRKADAGNANHIAAPMPGTIAGVAVSQGGRVARGDVLVTIEAMKMETSVRADRDATIAEIVTKPGESVDAKDLLVVLA